MNWTGCTREDGIEVLDVDGRWEILTPFSVLITRCPCCRQIMNTREKAVLVADRLYPFAIAKVL